MKMKESKELSLKLFVVLSRAIEAVEKAVAKDAKRYNLNLTEFGVLEFLFHKGEQPIQIIGKKVLLASSSITYVVDKLEKKELIERVACPKDRRVTYARLTDKGKTLMEEIFPLHEEAMAHIFSELSNDEKAEAIRLVKKIGLFAETI
ncbi:MarR family winged helix-turn-helix transcriptional regulator [Pseudogracilibacillus sp. SO10305]|uniref:MarR family winged helix-turn-helix transcriptional regulator n=1 Tax=Pseudogracilibacillus sp. SO10305 TaxID=3098292 RepID=UPI003FA71087